MYVGTYRGGGLRGVGVRFTDFGRFGLLGRVFFLGFCLPNLLRGLLCCGWVRANRAEWAMIVARPVLRCSLLFRMKLQHATTPTPSRIQHGGMLFL